MENNSEDNIEKNVEETPINDVESEQTIESDIDNIVKNKKIQKEITFEPKTEKGKCKVDCWHPEKNGDITPRDVSKRSRRFCWFICDVCGHDFQRTIKNIVLNNKWCQYCYENMICDNDDCEICYDKSFASFGE